MSSGLNLGRLAVNILKPTQINETVEMFAKQFFRYEPICYRITHADLLSAFDTILKKSADTTSIVYCKTTGEVLSGVLSYDYMEESSSHFNLPESMKPISNLMNQIKPIYYQKIGLPYDFNTKGEIFHQSFMGVKENARGLGLAQRALNHNTALAKLLGFSNSTIHYTSSLSLAVGLKRNYEILFDMNYKNIEIDSVHKNYWSDVPRLLKEEKLYVCNINLEEFQLSMQRFNGQSQQLVAQEKQKTKLVEDNSIISSISSSAISFS